MKAAWIFIFVTLAALSVQAEETDFCARPFEAVCGDGQTPQLERDGRIAAFRAAVRDRARAQAAPPEGRDWLRDPLGSAVRQLNYIVALQHELDTAIQPVEFDAVVSQTRTFRQLMSEAIEREIPAAMFPPHYKKIVRSTPFVLQIGQGLRQEHGEETFQRLMRGYFEACGPDAMSDRVYTHFVDEKPFVVVCAGRLIAAVGSGQDYESNFRNIMRVAAHELGHTIDSDLYPSLYTPYLTCLARRKSGLSGLLWVGARSGEITGDYWATQTVVGHLRTARLDARGKLGFIREAYAALCSSEDDGTHPDGRYRIETLLRGDRGIQELMGCSVQSDACSLSDS